MLNSLARGLGKLTLLLVSLTIITGLSLLLFGSYLLTWPVLRLSPRDRKIRVLVDLSSAAFAALSALQPPQHENADEPVSED